MAKGKTILNAALKALLAGLETSAWVKIPATFISEIASLPKDKRDALDATPSSKQFEELLTQSELSTTNAALAAVGTEQIKKLVSELNKLSNDKLNTLTELTQQQYKEALSELHDIHADTEEIKGDVKEVIKKLDQLKITDERRPIDSIIQNLPYTSIGNLFKGRGDVLQRLKDDLDKDKATAITQTIYGLGGIGKTRLAVEFCWRAIGEGKYKGVFFVNSETPELLHASIASLAGTGVLNLREQNVDQQTAELAVFQWLGVHKGWLIIFDNADTKESAEVIEALLPHLAAGHIIITSRYKHWSAAVKPQSLQLLRAKDASQFLLERTAGRRIETEHDESNAKQLAKELGYLPLTLEQAAAYIAHESITFSDYLKEWESDKEKVLHWCNEREMKYPVSAAVTWQRTFDKLSPSSRTVLRLAAFLAPEVIPTEMFEDSSDVLNGAMMLLEDKKPPGKSKLKIKVALSELSAYSMITRQQEGFTVHRILQEVIRTRIPEDKRRDWIEKTLGIVNDFAPTDSRDVRTWPVLDVLRPHAETIAKKADQVEITEPTSRLMSILGTYLHYKGLYHESEYWKKRALAIDEASLGKDHPDVATTLSNLALLYQATNRLKEAEPLMQRALAIAEASLGKDHPDVATALNNLAMLYQDTNRLKEAEPLMQRVVKIFEKSLGEDHPNVATALNNLAMLYQDTNRLKEAEPLMQRVVKIFEKSLGEDHPNVATALNNLAQLYKATNRLKEAEPLMQRALAITETSFGKDHPQVAIRLNNLARLYQATNRLKEAEPLMKRALKITEASLGKDHPNVAIRLNNLALLYKATNRLKEAEPLMERALKIDEASLGKNHPNVAIDLNNLARLYQATNRLKEAEPLMERGLVIFLQFTRRTGHPHPHLQDALENYGGLLLEVGYSKDQVAARLKRLAPEMFE